MIIRLADLLQRCDNEIESWLCHLPRSCKILRAHAIFFPRLLLTPDFRPVKVGAMDTACLCEVREAPA
jgi:hypothetical protein